MRLDLNSERDIEGVLRLKKQIIANHLRVRDRTSPCSFHCLFPPNPWFESQRARAAPLAEAALTGSHMPMITTVTPTAFQGAWKEWGGLAGLKNAALCVFPYWSVVAVFNSPLQKKQLSVAYSRD